MLSMLSPWAGMSAHGPVWPNGLIEQATSCGRRRRCSAKSIPNRLRPPGRDTSTTTSATSISWRSRSRSLSFLVTSRTTLFLLRSKRVCHTPTPSTIGGIVRR